MERGCRGMRRGLRMQIVGGEDMKRKESLADLLVGVKGLLAGSERRGLGCERF